MRQRAQMIVWIAIMLPMLFLPIAGLMIDAGIMFDAKRELQNIADGAARVGAMEIDRQLLVNVRTNPTGRIDLDKDQARRRANEYLARVGYANNSDATPFDDYIQVTVWKTIRPRFLTLVHVAPITLHATARARPCSDIVGNECR